MCHGHNLFADILNVYALSTHHNNVAISATYLYNIIGLAINVYAH